MLSIHFYLILTVTVREILSQFTYVGTIGGRVSDLTRAGKTKV